MKNITATARVQFVVELQMNQPWGEECPIGQLYKQAKSESVERMRAALGKAMPSLRIVGEPKVMGFISEEE